MSWLEGTMLCSYVTSLCQPRRSANGLPAAPRALGSPGGRAQGRHAALPPDPEEDRPSWGLGGTHPGRQGLQSSVRLSDLGEDKAGTSQPVPSSGRQGWAGVGHLCRGPPAPGAAGPPGRPAHYRAPGGRKAEPSLVMGVAARAWGGRFRAAAGA